MTKPASQPSHPSILPFAVMCVGMFIALLDIQIVASSLLQIQSGLAIPLNRLSWVQTAYLIAEIIAIPLTGWFTELMSLRRLFLAAVIAVAGTPAPVGPFRDARHSVSWSATAAAAAGHRRQPAPAL